MRRIKTIMMSLVVMSIGITCVARPVTSYAEETTAQSNEQFTNEDSINLLDDEEGEPSKEFEYAEEVRGSYAGSMYFKYVYGVAGATGYINVYTNDTSDIRIDGVAWDSWGTDHKIFCYAAQTTYASGSARCPTSNQISKVDYNIRVDGPEHGTNISGSKQFAPFLY